MLTKPRTDQQIRFPHLPAPSSTRLHSPSSPPPYRPPLLRQVSRARIGPLLFPRHRQFTRQQQDHPPYIRQNKEQPRGYDKNIYSF